MAIKYSCTTTVKIAIHLTNAELLQILGEHFELKIPSDVIFTINRENGLNLLWTTENTSDQLPST